MRLSDSEWIVMKALWERSPASVRDVLERIEGETGWAYTTVKTMLERLVEKGAIRVRKRANMSLFAPAITQPVARRMALRALVDRAFDGTFGSLLQHLVSDEKLSASDRVRLEKLLNDIDQQGDRT